MSRVVVGMSGGVDSSVAALLLKEQGHDVVGVTMQIWEEMDVTDAVRVSEALGIPHRVLDFREIFRDTVIRDFMNEYNAGRTPNPCCMCNRTVKWEALLAESLAMGADYIATGHYARIMRLDNGRYTIRNSVTAAKDQTYALYNLTQDQLARTLMPVGEYPKDRIRQMALDAGIPVADKPDSQEICFIPDHDYAGYVKRNSAASDRPGNFVSTGGEFLGTHRGIIHYTVGQRKGLGITFGKPMFVVEIRPETNEIVLGEGDEVFGNHLICDRLNFMSVPDIDEDVHVMAKIRYSHKGSPCTLRRMDADRIECNFEEPVRAITPGQAVVFYEEDHVLGGGRIISR